MSAARCWCVSEAGKRVVSLRRVGYRPKRQIPMRMALPSIGHLDRLHGTSLALSG